MVRAMQEIDKNELFARIKSSFSAETQDDLVKYFDFLSSELLRILSGCEEKREAVVTLENYLTGKIPDDSEIKKMLPQKAEAEAALAKLKAELAGFAKEYDVVETLLNSIMLEIKQRVKK